MLKHSYLLTSPTREAECQIRGLYYFIVLEKIHGRNLFPTATLFFVDLSPASAGGTFSPGRLGRRWGSATGSLSDDCTRSLACCRSPCQSSAVGRGPWQPTWLTRVQWDMSHYQGSAPHQERGWWQSFSGSAVLSLPLGPSSSALGSSPQRISWASTFCLFYL